MEDIIKGRENTNNKVTTISSISTDIQYPSAKAVYSYAANANNLISGTVNYNRLPVGKTANTVAAGDDQRFMTIPTSEPTGTPADGSAWIWVE